MQADGSHRDARLARPLLLLLAIVGGCSAKDASPEGPQRAAPLSPPSENGGNERSSEKGEGPSPQKGTPSAGCSKPVPKSQDGFSLNVAGQDRSYEMDL